MMYSYTPKSLDFHYLSSFNCKNEGVTMKRFNSDNNKNVPSTTEHSIKMVAFCNKRVWGTPVGYNVQICADIIVFSLSALVQLYK